MDKYYRVRYKSGDREIEVESSDKAYVDSKLAELLDERAAAEGAKKTVPTQKKVDKAVVKRQAPSSGRTEPDLVKLLEFIKHHERYHVVEKEVLDKGKQLPRVLMCLYFAVKCFKTNPYLTTGDIETITDQLGVKIFSTNANQVIKKSGKYFTGDKVRKRGTTVKYKLTRNGEKTFEALLDGKPL